MMKRRIALLLLSLIFVCSPKVWSQERFFDARVSGYGELEQVLGDKWNTIDSLVVHGPISAPDFKTIVRCAKDGNLRIVNLQYAQVENHKIPDSGFVDWNWYTSGHYLDIRRIILPDDITEFGYCAFIGLTLRQINIPSSLRKLGASSFEDNRWLEGDPLVIPEGVKEIPIRCFQCCDSLKRVVLPSSLKTIDLLAFYYARVKELNFPEGLDSIGFSAIYATHLTEIVLPSTVKRIGGAALAENKRLKRVVLPEGLSEIPKRLCGLCHNLEKINIPESVTKIERNAFQLCYKLKTDIPSNLTWVGWDAFDYCALDSIVFPSTVEYIEGGAFRDLRYLQKIYSLSPNPPHCTEDHANPGKGPFHGFTPKDIPVYVPIGSGEKYRQAFGWNYFTNIIETDKFPLGVEPPLVEGVGKYTVYGRDGSLVIELPEEPSSPILYSIYTVEGKTIAQGYLTGSHVLQLPSGGVYVVRVGTSIHKVSL
ncbi:leucine-rich repeat protein [Porphyromonas endodontalis]|uniref:leucine-rich repeat domain-containing protein n=1 Tax=Porphyromonas endodontalis TaxID=28124 RepID=UPI0028EC64EC|nr:leucine-rich repeat protein [Porphyromonas endodontalis]